MKVGVWRIVHIPYHGTHELLLPSNHTRHSIVHDDYHLGPDYQEPQVGQWQALS